MRLFAQVMDENWLTDPELSHSMRNAVQLLSKKSFKKYSPDQSAFKYRLARFCFCELIP